MTEDEAKTKWCPFVRMVAATDRTYPMTNREKLVADGSMPVGDISRCIASACMAWRWAGRFEGDAFLHRVGPGHLATDKSKPPGGYCGLAGAIP